MALKSWKKDIIHFQPDVQYVIFPVNYISSGLCILNLTVVWNIMNGHKIERFFPALEV